MSNTVKVLVFALLVFLLFASTTMANQLSAKLECKVCERSLDQTTAGETFYVEKDKDVALAQAKPSSGNHTWQKNGRQMPDYGQSIRFYANEDANYVLTVRDSLGSDSFTATIKVKRESNCIPTWKKQGIYVDDKFVGWGKNIQIVVGKKINIEASIDDYQCDEYNINWACDIPGVISFDKPNSDATTAHVEGYPGRNPKITITLSAKDGSKLKSQHFFLAIVKNAPPTIHVRYDSVIYSDEPFNVYFDESSDSDGYIKSIDAYLEDPGENEISRSHKGNLREGSALPPLQLELNNVGVAYTLHASITDNYGATTNLNPPLEIGTNKRGKNSDDKPAIQAPNNINCIAGQVCVINAAETVYRDRAVNLKFYDITGGDRNAPELAKPDGEACCCGECSHIFNRSAKIKIVGYYGNKDVSSQDDGKIVNVLVSANTPQAAKQIRNAPREAPEDIKIAITAICLFLLLRKKIRRMCGFF